MFKSREKLWIVAIAIAAILFVYLPLDSGGFYPGSKALMAILLLFFFAFVILFPSGEQYPLELAISAGIFFSFLLISTAFSTDVHNSIIELIYLVLCGISFVLGYYIIKVKEIFRPTVYLSLANLLIASIFGIFYFVIQVRGDARAYGRFYQADILAGFLIIFIPLALMLFLIEKNKYFSALFLLISALAVATCFLTFSRGAMLSLLAVTPFVVWRSSRYNRTWIILARIIVLIILATLIVIFSSPKTGGVSVVKNQIEKRIEDVGSLGVSDSALDARLDFYSAAIKMGISRPLTGVGLGNFGYHYPIYQTRVKYFSRYTHNFYLSILGEAGVPAFIALIVTLFFIGKLIKKRLSTIGEKDDFTYPAAYALSLGLIASLIHINLDVDFNFAGITFPFWLIAGILSGLGQENPVPPIRNTTTRVFRMIGATLATIAMLIPFGYFLSFQLQNWGDEALRAGDKSRAASYYERAIKMDPFDNEAYRRYAEYLYRIGQNDAALKNIDIAIKLSPFRARLFEIRGRILDALEKKEEAEASYERAIALDPINQVYAYHALAEIYRQRKQLDRGLEILEKALVHYRGVDMNDLWGFRASALRPQIAAIYLTMGNIYLEKGQYNEAIKALEQSLVYDRNIPSLFGIGYAYYALGEWQKAIESFLEVSQLQNKYSLRQESLVHLYLYQCYRNLGNVEKAREHAEIYNRLKQEEKK